MEAAVKAALAYRQQGWWPIPVPAGQKAPATRDWQNLRLSERDIPTAFTGEPNVGLLLGSVSGGLVDVDLDCPEARAAAPFFLPPAERRHGRASAPGAHWWYRCTSNRPSTIRYREPGGATLVELRADGSEPGKYLQTIVPPSTHPNGEQLFWEATGEPAEVDGVDLHRAGARVAACAMLVRRWPGGSRHEAALALGGVLLRGGLDVQDAAVFVEAVAHIAGDRESRDRVRAVRDTAAALAKGRPVTGTPRFEEVVRDGAAVAERLIAWLGLNRVSTGVPLDQLLAPFRDLEAGAGAVALESKLRMLAEEAVHLDSLRRAVLRAELPRLFKERGVNGAVRLVDAACYPQSSTSSRPAIAGSKPPLLTEPDPWPQAADGAELLTNLSEFLQRFVVLPDGAADAIALWAVHSHGIDAASISPILAITSPQKRCGKTLLLELLGVLVRRALPASNISVAALFRAVEQFKPTLLVDEADTFLAASDELRGVINSGHTRGTAYVVRTVGDDHEARCFSTWAAKALAAIRSLPDTILDRAIVIGMRRRAPGEHVERFRRDRIRELAEPLRQRAARWASDNLALLRTAEPVPPASLHDRAADNWSPLVAIADAAGGGWSERARRAAIVLSGTGVAEDSDVRTQLLADIRGAFEQASSDRLGSQAIVDHLVTLEGTPWPEWRHGKPVTPTAMARLLRSFGVRPKQLWVAGENLHGYERADFADAWRRYLPAEAVDSLEPAPDKALRVSAESLGPADASDSANAENSGNSKALPALAVENPPAPLPLEEEGII